MVAASRSLQAGSLTGKAASAATCDQAGRPEAARQRAAVGQVHPALGQQRAEAPPEAVGQHLGGSDLLQAAQRLQGRVGVLDQQHPAGPEGGDHGGQGGVALGHVHQDEAGVDQVEGPARRRVGGHVVLEDLDVGCGGPPAHDRLMSVASTWPAGPTRSDRWATTDVPPAPTSQQRQPGARPRPSRCRNVEGSNRVAKAVKRSIASGASLERR